MQMIINMINAKNEEGAVAFLDQEKAFDMVSFTTINMVFAKLNRPERFRAMLGTTYWSNHIQLRSRPMGSCPKTTSQSTWAPDRAARCPHLGHQTLLLAH
jgi:hypothetical protein